MKYFICIKDILSNIIRVYDFKEDSWACIFDLESSFHNLRSAKRILKQLKGYEQNARAFILKIK